MNGEPLESGLEALFVVEILKLSNHSNHMSHIFMKYVGMEVKNKCTLCNMHIPTVKCGDAY